MASVTGVYARAGIAGAAAVLATESSGAARVGAAASKAIIPAAARAAPRKLDIFRILPVAGRRPA